MDSSLRGDVVGSNVHLLKKLAYTRTQGDLVYFWPVREARRKQPPLVLRLVVLQGKRHPVYLLTSVLSDKRLSRCAGHGAVIEGESPLWDLSEVTMSEKQLHESSRRLRSGCRFCREVV